MTETTESVQLVIRRLNARAWGMSIGLVLGVGLLVATNILVLQGGPNVGAHLRLLSTYFPGYRVTFVGSLIGFVYAFVVGYGLGSLIAGIYDKLVARAYDRRTA
jgi:hypothetical protein